MKYIELKKARGVFLEEERIIEYKPLIQVIIESPQSLDKGASVDEMRKSIRILDALEKATDILELEDADYQYLNSRIQTARFTSNNIVFVNFVDDIEKAGHANPE